MGKDGFMRKIVLITFRAETDRREDAEGFLDRVYEKYPKMEIFDYQDKYSEGIFTGIVRGFVKQEEVDEIKRLTRYAEGMFEGTHFQNVTVSVEVCE